MNDTPPRDKRAEACVLGAMMATPATIADVTSILASADYYHPAHAAIHEATVGLWNLKEPVDMVTVAGALSRRGILERVGGAPYLHTLVSETPVSATATYYAGLVLDASIRRRVAAAGVAVTQMAYAAEDATQLAQDAQQAIAQASASAMTAEGGGTIGDTIDASLEWLDTPQDGAATPWPDVNRSTNGLLDGSMITVAARPGHGKSVVCANVALFTAKSGKPAHVATLEMSRHEYMARILSAEASVNLSNMLRREMSESEWARVGAASNKVRDLPLYIDDRERQTMAQIRAAARRTERRLGPLGIIGIDYAQLVTPADPRAPREQQVAAISRETKLLAKEFSCPVLLLAQLNRKNADRQGHVPMVTDLRESGSLEQDSDQVWLLHRPDQYEAECARMGEVDLIVGKNRNGPQTTVALAFQGHYARIVSMV